MDNLFSWLLLRGPSAEEPHRPEPSRVVRDKETAPDVPDTKSSPAHAGFVRAVLEQSLSPYHARMAAAVAAVAVGMVI
jgi:hypothetical protein